MIDGLTISQTFIDDWYAEEKKMEDLSNMTLEELLEYRNNINIAIAKARKEQDKKPAIPMRKRFYEFSSEEAKTDFLNTYYDDCKMKLKHAGRFGGFIGEKKVVVYVTTELHKKILESYTVERRRSRRPTKNGYHPLDDNFLILTKKEQE